ncbi:deoxyribonuclease-2 [Trichonephila clavata]|uniref:Deoxyribonuclease-2 n=1 Tax=Trichonephila clavata TaxID=2740835 RepID=A0A8X6KG07_TRICU|nr:deoxyribonuclease-2 [Trichonephila clavata]
MIPDGYLKNTRNSISRSKYQYSRAGVMVRGSSVTHLFYSDDPPLQYHKRVKKNIGHLKGYLAFDAESGMWLTHTIPKYTRTDKHKFPSNAIPSGHMAICITLPTEYLNSICHYLLYCHPNIYKKELTKGVKKILDKTAQSLFSEKPHFIGKPPFVEEFRFHSKAGVEFFGYAKDEMEESGKTISKFLLNYNIVSIKV